MGENMKTEAQLAEAYCDCLEREAQAAADAEQARAEENERLSEMDMAHYVAERMGRPAPLSVEELGKLSMPEYIKARSDGR